MAKKTSKKPEKKQVKKDLLGEQIKKLPPDVQKRLEGMKKDLDGFKDDLLKKFDDYIVGIGLLPPPKLDPKRVIEDYAYKNKLSQEDFKKLTEEKKKRYL